MRGTVRFRLHGRPTGGLWGVVAADRSVSAPDPATDTTAGPLRTADRGADAPVVRLPNTSRTG